MVDARDLERGIVSDTMLKDIPGAVTDTRREIAEAFDKLHTLNSEFMASLKQAAPDFLDPPYLDPEAIQSLHYTAAIFEQIPDYTGMPGRSAHQLRHLPETSDILVSVSSSKADRQRHDLRKQFSSAP